MRSSPRTDPHHRERVRVNFTWILHLRWAAAAGQLVTVLLVWWGIGVRLPIVALLSVLAFEVLSNLGLTAWLRSALRAGDDELAGWRMEGALGSIMLVDILLLTVLLYLTGGQDNPFAAFYLVNLVLAAVVLPPRWAWSLTAVALLGYASLRFLHQPLPELHAFGVGPGPADLTLQQKGVPVAFAAAVIVIALFVTRVTSELQEVERELQEARHRQVRAERLQALGTLAAGAAHELASPLSTIAVVAKDLELAVRRHGEDGEAAEDARLIRREVDRCRSILDQMSADAGQSSGEEPDRTTTRELFEATLAELRFRERVTLDVDAAADALPLRVRRRSLALALRQIVKNALDATAPEEPVRVEARADDDDLVIEVTDRGEGMTEETITRATDPFYTTKEPGQGMGLGLFLAHSVFERLDGRMSFESERGRGTRVRVALPLRNLLGPAGSSAEGRRSA